MNQVKKNLLFNIISLLVNVAIGILYTPYLVKSLGVVAYGVVPLALIINQYISVVTGSLTSALTRFYSIALQKGDKEEGDYHFDKLQKKYPESTAFHMAKLQKQKYSQEKS